jgi:hypothetical protein
VHCVAIAALREETLPRLDLDKDCLRCNLSRSRLLDHDVAAGFGKILVNRPPRKLAPQDREVNQYRALPDVLQYGLQILRELLHML